MLRTQRLVLRPGELQDAKALVAAMSSHDVVSQLAHVPWPYSLADAEQFIGGMQRDNLPRFLIFEDLEGEQVLVGGCGVSGDKSELKLGYWVHRDHWGRGIATEAVRALIEALAERGFHQIYAEHKPDNQASAKVLVKLGFAIVEDEKLAPKPPAKSHASMVMRVLELTPA